MEKPNWKYFIVRQKNGGQILGKVRAGYEADVCSTLLHVASGTPFEGGQLVSAMRLDLMTAIPFEYTAMGDSYYNWDRYFIVTEAADGDPESFEEMPEIGRI